MKSYHKTLHFAIVKFPPVFMNLAVKLIGQQLKLPDDSWKNMFIKKTED